MSLVTGTFPRSSLRVLISCGLENVQLHGVSEMRKKEQVGSVIRPSKREDYVDLLEDQLSSMQPLRRRRRARSTFAVNWKKVEDLAKYRLNY